jgi:hypothetical protein
MQKNFESSMISKFFVGADFMIFLLGVAYGRRNYFNLLGGV